MTVLKVSNGRCIRRLGVRSMGAARTRNIVAVLAIALTAVLFTSLFTIASSLNASFQQTNFRQAGGDCHGTFKNLTAGQVEELRTDPLIKEGVARLFVGMPSDQPFHKAHVEVSYLEPAAAPHYFCIPQEGGLPQEGSNEAAADTRVLSLLGVEPEKIFSVSVMPCTAKKAEAELSTMDSAGAGQDVDLVLTTREIVRMIRAEHIQVENLPEEACDLPLGIGTGAGVIFGATGGVMEAALRTAAYLATGKNPDPDAFKDVRGMDGWKEATFDLAGTPVRVAVASGLGNARRLIRALRRGDVHYDFVEVMACPGGCVGGGGQPIHDGEELAEVRAGNLYGLDRISNLRFSHENPSIQKIYREYFQQPMSEKAHHLLHTDHEAWEMPQAPALELDPSEYM